MELEAQIAEEKERCEQQMKMVRQRLESQATEVSRGRNNLQMVISLMVCLWQASIARLQRSVREKAIQNRIMEKVSGGLLSQ